MDKSDVGAFHSRPRPPERLRILLVVNLAWDARLGAVRVFMELAEQLRAAGHIVQIYSASEAFSPRLVSPALSAIRQIIFGYKAAAFVRQNPDQFDVVDALIGSLHGSKKSLGFAGLLVARSVGLYLLYERFNLEAQRRWPVRRGKVLSGLFYDNINRWFRRLSDAAVRQADLLNVPNEEEKQCLQQAGVAPGRITVQPYGLSPERRSALGQAAAPTRLRTQARRVAFIGMWAPRKGSRDWLEILKLVSRRVPEAHFRFLGTMTEPDRVLQDLGLKFSQRVEIIPQYSQEQLPELLSTCTVGAFPSYVEGFGIAVLEQLAAGLPTVAYDIAGPRDMLGALTPSLLVAAGDVAAFAEAVIRTLDVDSETYEKLAGQCREAAAKFDWSAIARETADIYRARLNVMSSSLP